MSAPSLYDEAESLGLVVGSHESDLYLLATPEAAALVKRHGWPSSRFRSEIDGRVCLDVPFAFLPWWRARLAVQS